MNTAKTTLANPLLERVSFSSEAFTVHLSNGLALIVPYWWYPRLYKATPAQRKRYEIIGNGIGATWEDIDEDIHVSGLLQQKPDLSHDAAQWRAENGFPNLHAAFPRSEKMYSVTEAAQILGISRQQVNNYIKSGQLEAARVGNTFTIAERVLGSFRPKSVGRPRATNPRKELSGV